MKLEFLLCGSLNDGFLSQIAFFRLCLARLGGDYARARVVAVLGDQTESALPARWEKYFKDIEVRWAHAPGTPNPGHAAQHNRRFDLLDLDADLSFLCDTDTALLRPMDRLVEQLLRAPALAGVIAHYHFPWPERDSRPEIDWPQLAQEVLGADLARPYRYTLLPPESPPEAPFYINFGFLAGPPKMLGAFHRRDMEIRPHVVKHLGEWWAPQVSLALTCSELNIDTMALPMRYNFPNDPIADARYPVEREQIVLLHYLRENAFQRAMLFADEDSFRSFLRRDLPGSNAIFQDLVKDVTKGEFPFPP